MYSFQLFLNQVSAFKPFILTILSNNNIFKYSAFHEIYTVIHKAVIHKKSVHNNAQSLFIPRPCCRTTCFQQKQGVCPGFLNFPPVKRYAMTFYQKNQQNANQWSYLVQSHHHSR